MLPVGTSRRLASSPTRQSAAARKLRLQTDGNLVLSDGGKSAWASNTSGEIAKANDISNPDLIKIGPRLIIPD